ncbi:hypothetical protein [uncultured Veillonella sp.]|uniref:hypothetical protein n=1 Tax=uncultured Veillonella sp. TaxID=159268 RepID=UPI0025F1490D|nr:hypothetical protein [uncultured Veillonella sp.]
MFKNDERKAAIKKLESVHAQYVESVKHAIKGVERLHEAKVASTEVLELAHKTFNLISDKPVELETYNEEIKLSFEQFNKEVEEIKRMNIEAPQGGSAVGGVAVGAGIATLGPTALMGLATTFGTASTGAAIGSLSGAAATNAALAWLGGGTLAAGGGGMALGNAFLALTGPIGWGIAGLVGVGGTLFARSKNTKIIEKANQQVKEINQAKVEIMDKISILEGCIGNIYELKDTILDDLNYLKNNNMPRSYKKFSDEEKEFLRGTFMLCRSLGEAINEKLS